MICTKRRLNGEIERIKKILLDNGYPKNIINAQIAKKITQFSTLQRFGPEKYHMYLGVPWINKPSENRGGKQLWFHQHPLGLCAKAHAACGPQRCSAYQSEKFCHIENKCHCDSQYVGRTAPPSVRRTKIHGDKGYHAALITVKQRDLHPGPNRDPKHNQIEKKIHYSFRHVHFLTRIAKTHVVTIYVYEQMQTCGLI